MPHRQSKRRYWQTFEESHPFQRVQLFLRFFVTISESSVNASGEGELLPPPGVDLETGVGGEAFANQKHKCLQKPNGQVPKV
jgi:hypothetical protein